MLEWLDVQLDIRCDKTYYYYYERIWFVSYNPRTARILP